MDIYGYFVTIQPVPPDGIEIDFLPKKRLGKVESPFSFLSLNGYSDGLFQSTVEIEPLTVSQPIQRTNMFDSSALYE